MRDAISAVLGPPQSKKPVGRRPYITGLSGARRVSVSRQGASVRYGWHQTSADGEAYLDDVALSPTS
jgi:hypothetical protein